ncbi:DUF3592 domain-containing protein [Escherichia coli]
MGEGELMAHDVPLGCAPDEYDDLISGTCSHLPYSKDAIHTEGVIVDTVWHSSHSHRTGKDGSWYPVVAFRPTPDYTLIFNSSIGSDFYEDSEGDKVNVYYSPGHPEKAEINNPWVNFFKWGFIGIMGVIFIAVGLLISMPSSKKSRRKRKSRP